MTAIRSAFPFDTPSPPERKGNSKSRPCFHRDCHRDYCTIANRVGRFIPQQSLGSSLYHFYNTTSREPRKPKTKKKKRNNF